MCHSEEWNLVSQLVWSQQTGTWQCWCSFLLASVEHATCHWPVLLRVPFGSFWTHLCFRGFALDSALFFALCSCSFSCFSCFFFHPTVTWKRSSSSSESLGLMQKFQPLLQACHCCDLCSQPTPEQGTLGWNTGPGWPWASPGASPSPWAPVFWPRLLPSRWSSRLRCSLSLRKSAHTTFAYFCLLLSHFTLGTSLVKLGSRGFGSLRMPFSTSSARKALAASRAAASAWASETQKARLPWTSHAWTFGTPLCVTRLFLMNRAGFCSPQCAGGCSAAATAAGASWAFSVRGVASLSDMSEMPLLEGTGDRELSLSPSLSLSLSLVLSARAAIRCTLYYTNTSQRFLLGEYSLSPGKRSRNMATHFNMPLKPPSLCRPWWNREIAASAASHAQDASGRSTWRIHRRQWLPVDPKKFPGQQGLHLAHGDFLLPVLLDKACDHSCHHVWTNDKCIKMY